MAVVSREVHLIARPDGMPREEEFAIVEQTVADAADGEIQVQNLCRSGDAASVVGGPSAERADGRLRHRPRRAVPQPLVQRR